MKKPILTKRRLLKLALCAALAATAIFAVSWVLCPPPLKEAAHYPAGLQIRDANGGLLRVGLNRDGGDCRPIAAFERDAWIVKAVIAAEDQRFFAHSGIDPLALLRAVRQNIAHSRRVSGASTISTQVVRLLAPRPRNLWSKYVETFQTLRLEVALPKDEILAQYLNRAPFGSNLVGIEAAAQGWFGKTTASLSLGEAALLAGMVQSPTRFRPDRHNAAALKRRAYVLDRMEALGFISAEQRAAAESAPLVLRRAPRPFLHPYYCDWAAANARKTSGELATRLVPRLQLAAEEQTQRHALRTGGDAAVVIVDVRTGHVNAMTCSGDYFSKNAGQVNTALAPRSAGSTLKPFLMAFALQRGLVAPGEVLADVPRHFGNFSPANADGTFHGIIRADTALVLSLNLPFIDLVQKLGVADFIAQLDALGLETAGYTPEQQGLGIAIGNISVRLVNLAQAYAMLACAAAGNEPPEHAADTNTAPLLTTPAAWLVSEMLSGVERSEDAVGHVADAHLPRFAWKTGTSTDYRDAWAVAWNPEYVVAVWCGSKSGRGGGSTNTGAKTAVPLAWAILRGMYPETAAAPWFPRPAGVRERRVCALSGKPPSRHCAETLAAFAITGTTAESLCAWHRAPTTPDRANSVTYPPDIAAFLKAKETQTADNTPRIVHPANGTVFKLLDNTREQAVVVKLAGVADDEPLWWFLDSVPVATTRAPAPWVWKLISGKHRITVATATASASITVQVE